MCLISQRHNAGCYVAVVAAGIFPVDFLLDDLVLDTVEVVVGVVTVAVCKNIDHAANDSLGAIVDDAVVPEP